MSASCLYVGKVVHIRRAEVSHRLDYKVFMGLFDLDELSSLSKKSLLFGYNRPAPISFHDSDHGDGSGSPLRSQIERILRAEAIEPPGGPIRILCIPRVLGYVFNPLSVYFCYDAQGELRATVHEVNNTFGERHFYAMRAATGDGGIVRQNCRKQFRVSPFLPLDLDYRFTLIPPDRKARVSITAERNGEPVLSAWFAGERRPLSSANLAPQCLSRPATTFKVILGIHWEALLLWIKLWKARKRDGNFAKSSS